MANQWQEGLVSALGAEVTNVDLTIAPRRHQAGQRIVAGTQSAVLSWADHEPRTACGIRA